jgi:hypothetical protein
MQKALPASSWVSAQATFRLQYFPSPNSHAYPSPKSCFVFFLHCPHPQYHQPWYIQFYEAVLLSPVLLHATVWLSSVWGRCLIQYSATWKQGSPLLLLHFLLCAWKGHTLDSQGKLWGQKSSGFLPFCSHPLIWGNVNGVSDCIMTDRQAQVCDGTHAIFLH